MCIRDRATAPLYNRAWFDYNQRSIVPIGSGRANDMYSPWNYPQLSLIHIFVQNRIFLECHYYDPYDFTIMPNDENFKSQWGAAFAGGDVSRCV